MANTRVKYKIVYLVLTLLAVPIGHAQMIRSDDLQQDTAKLNLCIDRARHGHGLTEIRKTSCHLRLTRVIWQGLGKRTPPRRVLRFQTLFMNVGPGMVSMARYGRAARVGSGMLSARPLSNLR